MRNAPRAAVVLASILAAAASATAPARHKVETTTSVPVSVDQAWEAAIDLFADNNWAIQNLDRSSGLITTDWMSLGRDGDDYADCGSAPLAIERDTTVRFNVRIKRDGNKTKVSVNASFRRLRSFDGKPVVVDCTSRGAIEAEVHREIRGRSRANERPVAQAEPEAERPPAVSPPFARGHFCSGSQATLTAGLCARAKADCVRARDTALGAIEDLSACALVETAWCFEDPEVGERCAPVKEACDALHARTFADLAPDMGSECEETE